MDQQEMTRTRKLTLAAWNLTLAAIMLYGMVMIGYLVARIAIGERWNVVAFANNFVPWWALAGLIACVIALFSRRRWWLVALQVPILIAFVALFGGLFWPRDEVAQANNGFTFTAATYNILSGLSDPDEVIQTIESLDADLIAFEELGTAHVAAIKEHFGSEYPYQVISPSETGFGVGLFSRFPVIDQQIDLTLEPHQRHIRAVLDMNGIEVVVYVAHPYPPHNFFSPISYDDSQRGNQLAALRDQIRQEDGPVLMLCDCNMTDQSDDYRAMADLLQDSFREAGARMGFTFPATFRSQGRFLPYLVRIDYIWHSDEFVALDAHVADNSGTSDHRPVIAELSLKQ